MDNTINQVPEVQSQPVPQTPTPTGNWKKGCMIMATPFVVLIAVLILWAAASSILGVTGAASIGIARFLNVGLGFIGILGILGIPVCLIVGLIVGASSKK